jgi:S-phase kinase-associated protein 1
MPVEVVTLVSSDGARFEVGKEVFQQSGTIQNMIEDVEGSEEYSIDVPGSTSKGLEVVIKYLNGVPTKGIPLVGASKLPMEQIFEIIKIANNLEVPWLLEAGSLFIAGMLNGKAPEEIRKLFGIENDFDPEEEARIRSENSWAFK